MKNFAYIRFVTYAVLMAALLWPTPKRHVIPVDLAPVDYYTEVDRLYTKRQASEDTARQPGFETTKRSGSEVMRLALAQINENGADLSHYRPPTITLYRREGKMKWEVHWEIKGMGMPGGFFAVIIDDETGTAIIRPGM